MRSKSVKREFVNVIAAVPQTIKTGTTETPNKGGVIFKVGKGEYRGFMASLEGVAGIGSGGTSKQ